MSRQLDDWLERYIQFTFNAESPTLYHLWSGITAISSALRRKCYCNWGLRGYVYPNLYVALVGPPGGRKGTAMKIAKGMVQQLEIPIGADSLGSTQALYKEIMNAEDSYMETNNLPKIHKSLSIWSEEFQVFLSERDQDLIPALTDLFDCADNWKYRTLKRGLENVSNCYLTIIGAITPSLLQAKLSQTAVGGGLTSRIIFVVGYGPIKKVALPFLSEEEIKLKQKLNEDLQQIANLAGPFKLNNDFLHNYSRWYENTNSSDGVANEKFMGYNSRRALHLNKLCMIISASESDNLEIHKHHFEKALAILEVTEAEMPNAFYGIGLADHANKFAKILRYIESKERFTYDEICNEFVLDALPNEVDTFLQMAERKGSVRHERSTTETVYFSTEKQVRGKGNDLLNKTLYRRIYT